MPRKHSPDQLGMWAKENGLWKWAEAYHPQEVEKRRLEALRGYNRRKNGEPEPRFERKRRGR